MVVAITLMLTAGMTATEGGQLEGRVANKDSASAEAPSSWNEMETEKAATILHLRFGELLAQYVRKDGVDYSRWSSDRAASVALDFYVAELTAMDPDSWPVPNRLAYWINLYNAATLQLVLKHYPVRSIKDVGGFFKPSPWNRKLVRFRGEKLSLNAIENKIIRPQFADPRIHFALNCASVGCPSLQPKPFLAESLDADLDAVCREAMTDDRWVKLDGDKVVLTKIFDWYEEDFSELGVIGFINRFRDSQKIPADTDVSHSKYDWALNDAK